MGTDVFMECKVLKLVHDANGKVIGARRKSDGTLVNYDGVGTMSKSKNNYVGITEPANTMFAKVLSISDFRLQ